MLKTLLLISILSAHTLAQATVDNQVSQFEKSPSKALKLSLLGTLAMEGIGGILLTFDHEIINFVATPGGLLIVSGLVIAPSFGHFYAHNNSRVITHILIRSASMGLVYFAADEMAHYFHSRDLILLPLGSAILLTDAIIDIVKAPQSAREFNRNLSVSPTYDPVHGIFALRMKIAI